MEDNQNVIQFDHLTITQVHVLSLTSAVYAAVHCTWIILQQSII